MAGIRTNLGNSVDEDFFAAVPHSSVQELFAASISLLFKVGHTEIELERF
jgi:hypothetical protein